MEELTIMLLAASLVMGAAVVLKKDAGSRAYMLSLALSIVAIGAVMVDPSIMEGEYDLTLSVIPPFIVMMVSLFGMLFSEGDRWLGSRGRSSRSLRAHPGPGVPTLPYPRAWAISSSQMGPSWRS